MTNYKALRTVWNADGEVLAEPGSVVTGESAAYKAKPNAFCLAKTAAAKPTPKPVPAAKPTAPSSGGSSS